jgi:hypothetical protein
MLNSSTGAESGWLRSINLQISPLVLGGNVFGWTANMAVSFAVLDAFVAGGGLPTYLRR